MAFNNQGHYWLANGENMWVTMKFGSVGTDRGAQWIMADPKPYDTSPTPSGIMQFEVSRFQKRHEYRNGGGEWSYNCLVENTKNPGWLGGWFCLSGGGNA
ncbi:hypothetical protein ABZY10_39105 [Streptomyces sp. NPDC006539]|uniref:hypothetical protein n=1 Tax=Streptomyces TaxID=1883 RepID=UPI00339781BB